MNEDLMELEVIQPLSNFSYIPISVLEKDFYSGTRCEVTEKSLRELASFAKTVKEPDPYGTYFDEEHYLQTLHLVFKTTEETRHRGIFFLKKILPYVLSKNRLLDVGPGCGTITRWIASKFKHVTIVDNNQKVIEDFNQTERILRKRTELIKIKSSILDVVLKPNYYDLGVISHVLYYLEKKQWLEAVQNVYNSLKADGILVIALSGDQRGKADLIKYFGGEPLDINFLAKACYKKFGQSSTSVFASDETFYTLDLATLLHIAGFFLYDVGVTATKQELSNYLIKHCLKADGRFELSTQQKFIVVRKKI